MTLFLLPNHLGLFSPALFPSVLPEVVATLDGLIAESPQGGRSFLNHFRTKKPPYQIPLAVLDKRTSAKEIDFFLEPVSRGECWGLVSDAGLPCIADPGATLVFAARQRGITIEAITGPCAITLALMLSGMPSQRFSFHGYVDKTPERRKRELREWEKKSQHERSCELFMDAPYRNQATLETAVESLKETSWLALACDLTLPSQLVLCQQVRQWRNSALPLIAKRPALFMIRDES